MKRRFGEHFRNVAPLVFLLLGVLLGGASGAEAGAIANAVLQSVSVLLIIYLLWSSRNGGFAPEARPLFGLAVIFVLFVLLSLIPLPPALWQEISGREAAFRGLRLLGMADVSLPHSLSPQATLASLSWVLPPIAALLLVLRTPAQGRNLLAAGILVAAILTVALGVAQLVSGPLSLRPYQITNPGLPVGMFANANHFGTLVLCALPFSGYVAARASQRRSTAKKSSGIAIALASGLFLLIGASIIGSLAAYGLLIVTAAATILIYRRAAAGVLTLPWIGAAVALFVLFLGFASTGPLQEGAVSGKFTEERLSRKVMAATTFEVIKQTFPVGTGLGSFPQVYRTYEDQFAVGRELVNHAHNDYLEVVMEMGLVGLFLILAFIIWWVRRSFYIWRSNAEGANLGRAGSIVVLVVLLHSLVDYPIRTSAIAVLFAMACALMIPPVRRGSAAAPAQGSLGGDAKHLEAD